MGFIGILLKFLVYAVLVAFVVVITLLNTYAFNEVDNAVDGDQSGPSISEDDLKRYKDAEEALKTALIIGWVVIALMVVVFVISLFAIPEEIAAAGSIAGRGASAELAMGQQFNKIERNKNNPLGIYSFFGDNSVIGWISRIIYLTLLSLLVVLGSYSAIAVFQIAMTKDRYGFDQALYAAILGITPFILAFIWIIAAVVYYNNQKNKERNLSNSPRIYRKTKRRVRTRS